MPALHGLIMVVMLVLLAGCGGVGGSQPAAPSPSSSSATEPPLPAPTPPNALPTPPAAPASSGAPLSLRVGEAATVGDVTLTLSAIEEDSRCPTRVACVWEGAAKAVITVAIRGQAGETAILTIYGQNREAEESRSQAGGYTIRLTALEPYPADPEPIPTEQYVATFVVEEGEVGYTVVGDSGFEGVIVPERDAPEFDPRAEGYWTPGEADVLALEAGLAAFLQAAAPEASPELWRKQPTYKRQYAGLLRDGRRLVYASFFCDTHGEAWRREPLFVLDGGDCFFQLTFDVERGTYGDLMVNGEA